MTPYLLLLSLIASLFAWRDYKTKNIPNSWMIIAYVVVLSVFNINQLFFDVVGNERRAQIFLIFFAVLWGVSLVSFFVLKVGGADVKFLPLLAVLAPWDMFWVLVAFALVLWFIEIYIAATGKRVKLPMFPTLAVALWLVLIMGTL